MLPKTKAMLAAIIALVLLVVVAQMNKGQDHEDVKDMLAQENIAETSVQAVEWKEFIPQNGKFKVMLPALPQHASELVPLPAGQGMAKYDMYLSQEKDGTTFMISIIEHPENFDMSKSEEMLQSVMKDMVAGSSSNKLIDQKSGLFLNAPCLDFSLFNNEVYVHCKTFISGKTLYVLVLSDRTKDQDVAFEKFIGSFSLSDEHETTQPTQDTLQTPSKS